MREGRYACTKVSASRVDELSHIHRISAWGSADALEAMRDPLEAVEITAHVLHRLRRERIILALTEQLEPPAER